MALHPLVAGYASVADAYERGRPEYPRGAVGALIAELGLAPGSTVLDLAAGTGKLSRVLIATGLDVVAVEPLGSLRELLAATIGRDRVLDGVAESIPLRDASVDAVTVADAFHWFDRAQALAEIRRVLRPGGGLAVLTTVPDWSAASWAHELAELVGGMRPDHLPHFDGPSWQDVVRGTGSFTEPREIRVTANQPTGPGRVIDHMASISWVGAMTGAERDSLLGRMRAVVAGGETPADFPIHVTIGLTRLA